MKALSVGVLLATWLVASAALGQGYRLPLGGDGHSCASGNCVITAYRDHGGLTDWACGDKTYAGHTGTDIAPSHAFGDCVQSFPVVAAAPGVVIAAHDGEQDHCDCDAVGCASGYGNHVMIQHADGKVTMYGHLAQWTVAVKSGDPVDCGTFLGRVGQTGNTTGPHLHFEVRVGGVPSDPYDGPCSGPPSYWVDQGGYLSMPSTACESPLQQGPWCGDGSCNGSESCGDCAADCGSCPSYCGDGYCDYGEDCKDCAGDCGQCAGPVCGDSSCDFGETCSSCQADCGSCKYCGDGQCTAGEDCVLCAKDCGACPAYCGDGQCNAGESCGSCAKDCGSCPSWCGDGSCNGGESCSSCAKDCGACAPYCGDGSCNGGESCSSCAKDCGSCGCAVSGHLGAGENGQPCYEAPETWRCAWIGSLGLWGSQVCRQGIWQTFNLNPSQCSSCCGGYSSACAS